MFFGQRVHPLNFAFAQVTRAVSHPTSPGIEVQAGTGKLRLVGEAIGSGLALKITVTNLGASDLAPYSDGLLPEHRSGRVIAPVPAPGREAFDFSSEAAEVRLYTNGLRVAFAGGARLEPAPDGTGIGQCGPQTIVRFSLAGVTAAYAVGERTGRMNRLGKRHDCYTIDVVGVMPDLAARNDYDPTYVSIPFVILRFADGQHAGLHFDSGERLNLDLGAADTSMLTVTAPDGPLPIYFIPGPTLRDVTRRFTALAGRAPIPPTWALGYHQCRWGYRRADEFRALRDRFASSDIPVSALWFDIDYMKGYRLFTWDKDRFPEPAALTAELNAAGIRTVAIIDPGVKREAGNALYEEGATGGFFCRSPSGGDYVGEVWPGDTVFPDFTLERTRRWWAQRLGNFLRESGIDGAWLDMNDPATGGSSCDEMLFNEGRLPHARYHNQYGHLMALASRGAFEQLERARPFLLTRSGFTGTQRHAAIWTGDNASNWDHLRMSIAETINLGLSGVAFNGPDVGGFLGHVDGELLGRWTQAASLFPFFRNHCDTNARPQEPWQFGERTLDICRTAIRGRYRLLPYLYQLFFQHWLEGDPILRPVCYHHPGAEFQHLDDQFLVGDALMVAPMLQSRGENPPVIAEGTPKQFRSVVLPPGRWFDLLHGRWLEGGQTLCYGVGAEELPIFVRDGAAIPYYAGPLANSRVVWRELEIHLFTSREPARCTYLADDLVTAAYQAGKVNVINIEATPARLDTAVELTITENGPLPIGAIDFRPVFYCDLTGAHATAPLHYRMRAGGVVTPEVEARLTTRRWLNQDIAAYA